MILLVPTRILAVFDHLFTMRFAASICFIFIMIMNYLVKFVNYHYTVSFKSSTDFFKSFRSTLTRCDFRY